MQPWFLWKGESSLDHGLWIMELPQPRKASERVEEITIPGRAGVLLYKEGDNIHESYVKDCKVITRSDRDFADVLTWLSGQGEVIFSNEQEYSYSAQIAGEVRFDKISNSLKQANIPFLVHPHKAQNPPETDISFSADGTLYNPGTVAAKPLVSVTFTSTCTVSIGGQAMTFTAPILLPPPEITIYVDCEAEIITDADGIWRGASEGAFWTLAQGESEVDLTDATISVKPRWRWF